jgi:hypothetical protein
MSAWDLFGALVALAAVILIIGGVVVYAVLPLQAQLWIDSHFSRGPLHWDQFLVIGVASAAALVILGAHVLDLSFGPLEQRSTVPPGTAGGVRTDSPVVALSSPAAAAPSPQAALRTVLDEHFADNQRTWPSNSQVAWLSDGVYRMFARWPGLFVAIGAPLTESLRDVVVTGTFRKVGGPDGSGYGLIIRDQSPELRDGFNQEGHYYVFEAGDRGEVGIWRRAGYEWVELLPWTPSDAVRPGGALNELMVRAEDQRLTFVVNGREVVSMEEYDTEEMALREGGVGIFVGGDFNDVLLERFIVQVPSSAE